MPNKMHSYDTNSSNVPAFLVKLWKLVEDSSCNDLIAWSDNGMSFIIRDQARFAKELLPQYFKHNNMASFIRQLNMYGFRKVMNYEKSGLRNENDEMEFQHSFFMKDQEHLLELIKRKIPNTKMAEPIVKANAKDILTDLTSIREKQENMDSMLIKMKQENELLWRELTSMRQKHKAQEHVIQKVIQFLVSIVQRSNQNIGVQRKIPRMLHDSPGNNAKNSQVTRSIDALRKKPDCILTVSQDKIVNPLGPVIHEVTDFEHEEVQSSGPSPCVKSPDSKSESENATESECPLDSSLNSPMNTSAMEPLSILEPLQPQTPALSEDSESVLGIPLEYITATEHSDGNYVTISIPEDSVPCDSEALKASEPGTSFTLNPQNILVYSPLPKTEYEDPLLTESLQTPEIPTIHIEDTPESALPKESTEEIVKQTENDLPSQQNTANNEHNYQLAVSEHNYQLDTSNAVKSSLTRNSFSNHLITLEEHLNWLQDQMTSTCDVDPNNLLAVCPSWDCWSSLDSQLFSTDDVANNECLAVQIAGDSSIKNETNDIVGNELVQFTPNLLEVELDEPNAPFFDCINRDNEVTSSETTSCNNSGDSLLENALNNATSEVAASEAAEFLLNNGTILRQNTLRRLKTPKTRSKRRKIK